MFWKELRPDSAQTHFIIHYISFFSSLPCLALLVVQAKSHIKPDLSYNTQDLTHVLTSLMLLIQHQPHNCIASMSAWIPRTFKHHRIYENSDQFFLFYLAYLVESTMCLKCVLIIKTTQAKTNIPRKKKKTWISLAESSCLSQMKIKYWQDVETRGFSVSLMKLLAVSGYKIIGSRATGMGNEMRSGFIKDEVVHRMMG